MNDEGKTKEQLIKELAEMRRCFEELAASEAGRTKAEEEVRLLQTLTIAVNDAKDLDEGLSAVLRIICRLTGWVYGEAWHPSPDGKVLEMSPIRCSNVDGLEQFINLSEGITFTPGKGLPGRVWKSKKPIWVKDVTKDDSYLRIPIAREAGLKTALAAPIISDDEVVAVIVFYMREASEEDDRFVNLVSSVSVQIGSVVRSKAATDMLKKNEEYYRSLIENVSDIITVLNLDGTVRYKSPSFERAFGYLPEEVLGRSIFDYIHPEDLLYVVDVFKNAVNSPGVTHRIEVRHRHKDGSWRTVETVGKYIKDEPVNGLICNSRDITERKKAEEDLVSLKKAIETMQIGVTITDIEGTIIYLNSAEARMHGYMVEELIGKNVRIFSPPEKMKPMSPEELRVAVSKERESVNLRKDGSRFPVLLSSDTFKNSSGEVIGMITTCGDMTNSKRLEEELMKVARLESLGLLAGGIAHDFNNIMTIILGKISLAKMYLSPDDKATDVLTSAEKGCKRAKDLTAQLLTFSKGGTPIRKKTSMTELIKESTEFALKGSNVKCDLSIAPDLWPVEIDEGQMGQVINNLIMNANQAMPKGGVIKVAAANVPSGKMDGPDLGTERYVKISIIDQGVGIPPEELPKIFDPYFTTKTKVSGLGLSTSYFIVKKHDGFIRVESEVGVGTSFYIYLPAFPDAKVVKEKVSTEPVKGKGKILVIDDEAEIRETAVMILEHLGYSAAAAEDGAQGVEMYRKAMGSGEPFAAALVDLTIPGGMGGKEAIQKLLEIDPHVKAIVTSGYSNNSVMADFKQYGFSAVVVKPYGIAELSSVLDKVVRGE